ncbi:Pre-mRNA-processing protein 40A, partial [Zostera marina]
YFYNKITKQSKWTIPEEVKLAREKMDKISQTIPETVVTSPIKTSVTSNELPSPLAMPSTTAAMVILEGSISDLVTGNDSCIHPDGASGSPSVSTVTLTAVPSNSAIGGTSSLCPTIKHLGPFESTSSTPLSVHVDTTITNFSDIQDRSPAEDVNKSVDSSCKDANKAVPITSPTKSTPLLSKVIDEDQSSYANKQEAKDAFKSLLQSTNIQSDWTWEQAMRLIINDKRYGALKTLGERKQAFNQYLSQKKKKETEERRNKQKKSREEFLNMLEESKELKSSTRWSKAILMFEGDERFNNVEHHRDREDLFEAYIIDLEKMERAKILEEYKRNVAEYKVFLRSCDFIKPNSQWRKIQDHLEKDESCFRLDKFDRLKYFQEYLKDLEKEEEEQRKIQKEQVKREERKNRDDFRKLMQEHVSDGIITAKTHWRDYCMKIKDLPIYVAVASNASGATPKDLFEDVIEELQKQYKEDRMELKDAMKMGKFFLTSKSTFEDLKIIISMDDNLQCISKINLKLVYDELLERVKEKEAKQAKKRQRLAENFSNLLSTIKEISSLSKWEECKPFFEDSEEYKSISEECFGREVFDGYVLHLFENAKEIERKRDDDKLKKEREKEERDRRKDKERKEKEKEWDREKGRERHRKDDIAHEGDCIVDANVTREERKRERERKYRRHHHKTIDDSSSDRDEREGGSNKKSRRHSSGRTRSRSTKQHGFTTESDTDSKPKKQKKEANSHRSIYYGDLEDGEVGEDGEIRVI